jgi:ParB-like chromosome segregation protein Spo0J
LIYGARRLFVATVLNCELLVNLRTISDREAVIEMDVENRTRKDISPYERGLSYKKYIREGYFRSQSELSKALGVSQARVSRLLRFADLPSVVVSAFSSPLDIRESWAVTLADRLSDPSSRQRITEAARRLAALRYEVDADGTMKQLLASLAPGRKLRPTTRDEVVAANNGETLFRVSRRSRDVHVILPVSRISEKLLELIKEQLAEVLLANSAPHANPRTQAATQATSQPSGGHPKLPHPWPGQIPPAEAAETPGWLRAVGALRNTRSGFFQPPALALEVRVMHESVEQRSHDDDVAE